MSTRTGSHQLSNGLYVSGRPEQLKERQPTMASRAVPYTGGDIKSSGELGKMYGIAGEQHAHPPPTAGVATPTLLKPLSSRLSSSSQHNSGSMRSGPNSGPLVHKSSNSLPIPKKYTSSSSFSGPMTPIQPTGLITSGPLGTSISGRNSRSGQLELPPPTGGLSTKVFHGSAVTSLGQKAKYGVKVSRALMWLSLIVVVMCSLVGAFLMVALKRPVILVAVLIVTALFFVLVIWNLAYKKRGLLGFFRRYPDAELRGAAVGQYVKVTGVC